MSQWDFRFGRRVWKPEYNMAEFAIAQDGHAWNNSLAHATFEDNVATHGKETALKFLRQDIRSWINEQKNKPHQWSLFVRGGHMMTETGVSLDKMTSNITNGRHSDLVPETIKATALLEAATLEEATRLAAMGANRIVLPEQHEDASGNIVSRYLSVWTKNALDPSRYDGSRIDLGKNIRIEDVRTGASFTAFGLNEDITFHQHGEQKQAFVLEVKNDGMKPFEVVEKAIITTIHRSHQETYSHDLRGDASLKDERQVRLEAKQERYEVFDKIKNLDTSTPQRVHDTDLFIHVPRAVVRETVDTVRGVAVFLRDKEKRKEGIDRIRRVFAGEKKDEGKTRRPNVQPERLTIEKIREKPEKIVKTIETRHAEMQKSMGALLVAAETKVALGAVPLILVSLAKEHPKPIRPVEKSIRRHKKKELRTSAKWEVQKDSVKVQLLRSERVESLRAAKERKRRKKRTKVNREMIAGGRRHIVSERSEWKTQERRVRRGKEKGIKIIATASKMIPSASEKREGREKRRLRRVTKKAERMVEAKKLSKKEKKLWIALAVAAGEFFRLIKQTESNPTNPAKRDQSRQAGPVRPIHETMRQRSNEKMKDKRRKTITGVQFAWIVWMMLNRANFLPVASKPAMLVSERRGVKFIHPSGVEQERSPWVLLSIIWHLTMLREQGTQNTTNTTNTTPAKQDPAPQDNTTNHQMKKRKLLLPQYAVIFAYNS